MTTAHRQMTDAERDFLNQQSAFFRQSGMVELMISAVWSWFYFSAFGAIIIGVARQAYFLLFGLPRSALSNTAIFGFLGGTLVLSALFCFLFGRTSRAYARAMLKAIATDLVRDTVEEEKIVVKGVKCFQEQEHFGRIYFLLFNDTRVFVRYDDASPNMDCGAKSERTNFPIHSQLTMIRFPQSGLVNYDWSGPNIRKPKAIPLTLNPKDWPEDGTYCTIPWDNLDAVLSPPG